MAGDLIKSASYTEEVKPKLPKGAKIISKEVRVDVEKIENGYIIKKNFEIRFETQKGGSDYMYFNKKWYSKEDPIEITLKDENGKELAENFDVS